MQTDDVEVAIRPRGEPEPKRPGAEAASLHALAAELGKAEGDVLGRLAEQALEYCGAHSAGVSILEMEGFDQVFRWHAVRGDWKQFEGGGLPRNASPCGVTVARGTSVLMRQPGRIYPKVAEATPPVEEVLLAPFKVLGETVGTVWVIAHDRRVSFDAEDARFVEGLAEFAGSAFMLMEKAHHAIEMRDEVLRVNARLTRILEKLQKQSDD